MGPQIWSFQARTRWWICSLITLNLWSVTTVTHSMLRMSQCAVLFQSPQLRHASYLHDVHNLLQLQLHSTNGSVFFLSLLSNILQKSLPEIPIIDNLHQSAGYLKLQKEKIIEGLNVSLITVSLSIVSPIWDTQNCQCQSKARFQIFSMWSRHVSDVWRKRANWKKI